jgi:hypothetical protein
MLAFVSHVAYTRVYADIQGSIHRTQGESLHEQPQPGGAPAEGVSVPHAGGVHSQRGERGRAVAAAV